MPDTPPSSPTNLRAGGPPQAAGPAQVPLPGRLVGLYLLAHPVLKVLVLWSGRSFLNLQPARGRGWIIYGLAAPLVGWLVWRRHPRARFALYVFMTLEAWRAFDRATFALERPLALAMAAAILLLFQMPALLRAYPAIERDRYRRIFSRR
ncbi:MAG: hypothetical protein HYY96_09715 [Candidatus Tectomicrobia bacterium]|nr:hypothetical protein [Candidatus Tectomicrobia bacterium]